MKKGCLKVVLIGLGVIMLLGVILEAIDPTGKPDKELTYADLSSTVEAFANKTLVPQLKYPDGWEYEYSKSIRDDSTKYTFQAIILAKNGFGVRSRLSYLFQMEYVGTKEDSHNFKETAKRSNWKILRSDLGD